VKCPAGGPSPETMHFAAANPHGPPSPAPLFSDFPPFSSPHQHSTQALATTAERGWVLALIGFHSQPRVIPPLCCRHEYDWPKPKGTPPQFFPSAGNRGWRSRNVYWPTPVWLSRGASGGPDPAFFKSAPPSPLAFTFGPRLSPSPRPLFPLRPGVGFASSVFFPISSSQTTNKNNQPQQRKNVQLDWWGRKRIDRKRVGHRPSQLEKTTRPTRET